MPAKKAAKKAVVKAAASPPAKKTAKKTARKAATGAASPKAAKRASAGKAGHSVELAAYLNYRSRVEKGLPGDHIGDWLAAEKTPDI
jgi:hypothetical protein